MRGASGEKSERKFVSIYLYGCMKMLSLERGKQAKEMREGENFVISGFSISSVGSPLYHRSSSLYTQQGVGSKVVCLTFHSECQLSSVLSD